jgi:SAM-dependent methyltransferase
MGAALEPLRLRLATFFEFVVSHLPPAPARVLEVGCGGGELALALAGAGHSIVAIDPRAPEGPIFRRTTLEDFSDAERFDAVVASVSLHHVADLDAAVERLAALLRPGGSVILEEFAKERFVGPTREWYHERRRALEPLDDFPLWSSRWDEEHADIHTFAEVSAALEQRFATRHFERRPYLFDYRLADSLEPLERELIEVGAIEATGVRYVGGVRLRARADSS